MGRGSAKLPVICVLVVFLSTNAPAQKITFSCRVGCAASCTLQGFSGILHGFALIPQSAVSCKTASFRELCPNGPPWHVHCELPRSV